MKNVDILLLGLAILLTIASFWIPFAGFLWAGFFLAVGLRSMYQSRIRGGAYQLAIGSGFLLIGILILFTALGVVALANVHLQIIILFVLGLACSSSYLGRRAADRSSHCRVTGPGFLLVALLILLATLGGIALTALPIWLMVGLVLLAGFGFEWYRKSKTGSRSEERTSR